MTRFDLSRAALLAGTAAGLLMAQGVGAASLSTSGFIDTFDEMGASGTTNPDGWTLWTAAGVNTTWTNTTGIPASGVASMTQVANTLTATNAPSGTKAQGFNAENVAAATPTAADRTLATSPTQSAGEALQLQLTNSTGGTVSGLSVSFDTDRLTTVSTANELPGFELFYSTDDVNWTNVLTNPTLATVPNSIGVTSTGGSFSFATAVASGASIYLRFVDDDASQTSPDQIIGLNNVVIAGTPVPLPPSVLLMGSALGVAGLWGRRRRARG